MKDKRTAKEKSSHAQYLQTLSTYGVVGCRSRIIISPPSKQDSAKERVWTLCIENVVPHRPDKAFWPLIVVAWHKTRASARAHAKKLRKALNVGRQ